MIRTINNAMAQRRAELRTGENDKGFTLIELMVVIIIIGILAAIAIPVFLNQRQQAWEGAVTSDLTNAAIAAESYSVTNDGSYDGLKGTDGSDAVLQDNGFKPSDGVTITVTDATDSGYKLKGVNENLTGDSWTFDSTVGKAKKD